MTTFIDPRTNPQPPAVVSRHPTNDADDLTELIELCKAGDVYGVERWIREGRPLQLSAEALAKLRRKRTALQIAFEKENRALALLLLCNGYDPNLEADSPLNIALVDDFLTRSGGNRSSDGSQNTFGDRR